MSGDGAGAGAPLLVVEHEADAGLGRLAASLPAVDVRRPYLGDPLPRDLTAHGGLIVLGGEMAAWEDAAPWLPATRVLLRTAVTAALPTLGICLGAQLLASACGGSVREGDRGLEVGLMPVELLPAAADDPLLGGVLRRLGPETSGGAFLVPQYHRDEVVRLPDGAVPLATGPGYPHQAFRVGDVAWGLQYHPEVTGEDFAAWVRAGAASLVAVGLDPAHVEADVTGAGDALDEVAAAHARAFADVVVGHAGVPAG